MEMSPDVRSQRGDNHESPSLAVTPARGRGLVKNTIVTETADVVDANQSGWYGHGGTIDVIDGKKVMDDVPPPYRLRRGGLSTGIGYVRVEFLWNGVSVQAVSKIGNS
jgi:hypothetical protein